MKKIFFFVAFALCSALSFGGNIRFEKITDASKLQDNDSVILVCESAKMANGTKTSTGKQLASVAITINSAGEVEMDEETAKSSYLKLMKSGTNWKVMRGTLYMRSSSTDLNFSTSATGSSYTYTWSITCNNDSVLFASTNAAYGIFRYHPTSKFFRTYTSKFGNKVQLYRRISNQATSVTGVTLNKEALSMRVGDAAVTLTATVAPTDATNKMVSWGSTNTSVASVTNGTVSFVGEGTAKVWVKTEDGDKTDTCNVTVLKALDKTKVTYNIVQKADYLSAGAKVFFGSLKSSENVVMSRYEDGNNIKAVAATYKDDAHHSVESELQYAYTVQRAGDYYVFVDQDGYYLRTLTSSKLGKGKELDDYAKWAIGEFNADDATVEIKNVGCSKYLYYNCNDDLFNIYDNKGNNLGTNFTKVVLYSSEAPAWVEREKNPTMTASGDALSTVDGKLTLEWGKQEPDPDVYGDTNPWGDSRKFIITVNDLSDDVDVTLDDLTGTFYCGWVSSGIKKDRTSPAEITVFWEAASKGTYTATLKFHTATAGVDDIEVILRAEAIDPDSEPENQPKFSASVDHVYLNPNYVDNAYNDIQQFTFSAKNLQKNLYCKWEHSSNILFDYAYQNQFMEIVAGSSNLTLGGTVNLGTDDCTNEEVTLQLNGLTYVEQKYYQTDLQFYSFKKDSKTDYAIDVTIPVMIVISDEPAEDPTGMESVESSVSTQKIIRNGQLLIIRNNEVYSITGSRIKD